MTILQDLKDMSQDMAYEEEGIIDTHPDMLKYYRESAENAVLITQLIERARGTTLGARVWYHSIPKDRSREMFVQPLLLLFDGLRASRVPLSQMTVDILEPILEFAKNEHLTHIRMELSLFNRGKEIESLPLFETYAHEAHKIIDVFMTTCLSNEQMNS